MDRDQDIAFWQREGFVVCLDTELDPNVAEFHGERGITINPQVRDPRRAYRAAFAPHSGRLPEDEPAPRLP